MDEPTLNVSWTLLRVPAHWLTFLRRTHIESRRMARMRSAVVAAALSLLEVGPGCGSPLASAGSGCSGDDECAAGLACLGLAKSSGGHCLPQATLCSKPCRNDGDCAAVGPDFKCIATCSGAGVCGPTE
jgi:hypothetical protein